jgi:thiamine-phosphate pyrophosphorylase
MNGPVLRLIDANANRAREALRVGEDYARFVLNDDALCGSLKALRHDLASATKGVLGDAVLHRDTPGDVGTTITTESEAARADLSDVVTAAGKRLGEALRSIEEGMKVVAPHDALRIESLRYRWYDLEQQIARTIRPPACAFAHVRLYVLVSAATCSRPWLEAAEEAILGGADCLQLREKELEGSDLLSRARQLTQLCHRHGIPCIINDRPDIAMLCGADGVHVGQGDLPAAEVRKLIGRNKILGVSTHCLEQAKQAVLDGADYLGVGPFFRSPTKPRDFVAGPAYARQVAEQISIPGVAIAGITAENVGEVLATGIRAVAVTAAVMGAKDVRGAARTLKETLLAAVRDARAPVGQTISSG